MCVSQGHVDEMWGLATHPSQNIFLTCGHDRQVCLWNTEEHKLDWCITLEVRFLSSNLHSLSALFISIRDLLQGSLLHNSEFFPVSLAGVRPVCWFLPQWIGGVSRPQYRTVSQGSSSCISELNAEKSNKLRKHFSVLLHPQALDIETFWRIFTTMDQNSEDVIEMQTSSFNLGGLTEVLLPFVALH